MDIQQVIEDTKYSVRTQISLSSSLYRLIKDEARKEQTSLAAIIRKYVMTGLKEQKQKEELSKERLQRLTNLIESLPREKSGWARVKNPHKLIRKWREEDDKKREEMLQKAMI